eukprot:g5520.t1
MKVMSRLAAAKYPEDPTNRSYQISRQRWIAHYVRQLQLAISNGAAPAISRSFRKLLATSTDLILQNLEDLDPPREHIPAFSNGTEVHEDKTAYESLDRRGTVITTQGPIFHDQEPREMLIQNDPDSDNGFIPLSSDDETSPSLIRKETATPSTPTTSPSLIGHDDEMTPPRNDPTANDQDSRTPATTNKQRKAAHNESNQARLNQQSNRTTQEDNIDVERIATREREGANDTSSEKGSETRTTQDSEDDIDIDAIATREREKDRTREEERERGRDRANYITIINPTPPYFENVANDRNVFIPPLPKQSEIKTSPNCIFPQWDSKLHKWDAGSFCHEEILTGGACVGDVNMDGYPDIFYPTLSASNFTNGKLYINNKNGTFMDKTAKYFHDSKFKTYSGGNACIFIDIDNDGCNDLYISTIGQQHFDFFKNSQNGSKYIEATTLTRLGNIKNNYNDNGDSNYFKTFTAGFSVATADANNDGWLDIITTEWLPLLNMSPQDVMNNDKNKKHIQTNSRFFLNSKNSTFIDYTKEAKLQPILHAPKEEYFSKMCDQLKKPELYYVMSNINEPYKKAERIGFTRFRLKGSLLSMMKSKFLKSKMNHTLKSSDPNSYKYFSIPISQNEVYVKEKAFGRSSIGAKV